MSEEEKESKTIEKLHECWSANPFVMGELISIAQEACEIFVGEEVEPEFSRRYHDGQVAYVHGIYDFFENIRAYIRYGKDSSGRPYWTIDQTNGAKVAVKYPKEQAAACFSQLASVLSAYRSGVNSSPMSPSYCHIEPEGEHIISNIKKWFPEISSDEFEYF